MPACSAAPWATASSAETEASGSLPDSSCSIWRTIGIRVDPPTSSTRSMSVQVQPAARSVCLVVKRVRSSRSWVISSNFSRVISIRSGGAFVVAADGGLGAGGERSLGVFAFAPQPAGGVGVFAGIELVLPQKFLGHEIDQPLIPVVAAEPHVAVGGQGGEFVPAISITVTSNVPPPRS